MFLLLFTNTLELFHDTSLFDLSHLLRHIAKTRLFNPHLAPVFKTTLSWISIVITMRYQIRVFLAAIALAFVAVAQAECSKSSLEELARDCKPWSDISALWSLSDKKTIGTNFKTCKLGIPGPLVPCFAPCSALPPCKGINPQCPEECPMGTVFKCDPCRCCHRCVKAKINGADL